MSATSSTPGATARATRRAADLAALTKPRITALLVATGWAGSVVAAGGWPGTAPVVAVGLGGGLAASGAGAMNIALEADVDARMQRTQQRPVPAGRLPARAAFGFGLVLQALAASVLVGLANPLAAALALAGTAWYVVVYTLWLKRRTPHNIVIGGAAGSFPPLVGYAAVTGGVDGTALVLAGIVLLWTPAHFWALATLLADDYARAGIPMLPVVAGRARTARLMTVYAGATLAFSLTPLLWGGLGWPYGVLAAVLGGWFLCRCHTHRRQLTSRSAGLAFRASLAYLVGVFGAAALDRALL